MLVKEFIKKIIKGNKYSSKTYIDYLRSIGCIIGDDVTIYEPSFTSIDETRPWLISIRSHVNITRGVTILTHGYDWAVLKTLYGDVLGSSGGVYIGDNVFIGMNTTILKGVHIGSNVIIGAGSLVNKDIPSNVVAAGNPCRPIMSIDEYYKKRQSNQVAEVTELIQCYRERYNREPDEKALHEFFWLFSDNPDELDDLYVSMQKLCDNYEYSNLKLRKNRKRYKDYKDMLSKIL